ncbi:hypothetical protein G6F19_012268 [Rhizopus arrhizus]|nr:hypothetical protein G6F19_012268 [Rhizopus arrhizus]
MSSNVSFIQPSWSDHFLVTSYFALRAPAHSTVLGKSQWRAHPRLASSETFRNLVSSTIANTMVSFDISLTPQEKWDMVKSAITQVAKSFSRRSAFNLTKAESLLHLKRARITKRLASNPELLSSLTPQLSVVESQLASLQQYHAETLALRAGIRWREQGEISAGYLKRTVSQRQTRQIMKQLVHPTTGALCCTSNEMLDAAVQFYSNLYSPEPIDNSAIDDLLSAIPDSLRLSDSNQRFLTNSFTHDDLIEGVSRCPRRSSPGLDGLPYEILHLIFIHPASKDLVLQVYNDALSKGVFPPSWFSTSVSLLPKKGDLKDLKNWRPISLINADAKVFTRLFNSRIVKCAQKLVTPYQAGFLRGRFIADNGLLMKLIMEHARLTSSDAVGLLLDQEKAYDRVHPSYLCKVLHHFGFPPSIVQSLSTLFFNTGLHINVNGFLSSSVLQHRGLRQGDPISPVLFNLAFEPLLRRILSDPHFSGFQLPKSVCSPPHVHSISSVKLLAYADDIVCLLKSPQDLTALQHHLHLYSKASNAKVNFNKTKAFALSGSRSCYHRIWRTPLLQQQIHSWHDGSSSQPIIYLGFPLHSSIAQRDAYLTSLLSRLETSLQLHSHRSLSFRGRVTILNSLILSKLWHVLRILSVPKRFFLRLQSQISGFVSAKKTPRISFETMCFPRNKGGLGVLNPPLQQSALQLRWLLPLLHDFPCSPTSDF